MRDMNEAYFTDNYYFFWDVTMECLFMLGIALFFLLIYLTIALVRHSRASEFCKYIESLSANQWRNKCIEHVVEKINVTNSVVDKKLAAEEVVAQCIYNHDAVKQLGLEMAELFGAQYKALAEKYPELSALDLLVLALLAIDMSNAEICSVLRMEKRTLYRRRQLIAQRVEISSTELEAFAAGCLLG